MTIATRAPEPSQLSDALVSATPPPGLKRGVEVRPWWAHLAWVVGASIVGFAIPALFAGGLHLSRPVFVLLYAVVSLAFLSTYVRWSGVDVPGQLRRHWVWGVVGAIVAGAFVVSNVLNQPPSATPAGVELIGAILWLGVVYGSIDALMLSILPLFATWQALSSLGWTQKWYGRAASGVLALLASVVVAAAYHLGYPEFHGASLVAPLIGNGVLSLASLLTMNPIAAVGAHVAMHIAAVLHGAETTLQLPPHY